MPLFNFTTSSYGNNWFVSACNRDEAIEAVKRAIHAEWQCQMTYAAEETAKYGRESERFERESRHRRDNMKFLNSCINNAPEYDGGALCSIEELEDGVVVFTEIA